MAARRSARRRRAFLRTASATSWRWRLRATFPQPACSPSCRRRRCSRSAGDHLHDTDLSPQHAADHVGISLRTLHSRFAQIGQTFGHLVLQSRLEACARALRDPNQRLLNISEIAYRWGFNDLSHFNRAFRAHFDMSPGEWRNAAASRLR